MIIVLFLILVFFAVSLVFRPFSFDYGQRRTSNPKRREIMPISQKESLLETQKALIGEQRELIERLLEQNEVLKTMLVNNGILTSSKEKKPYEIGQWIQKEEEEIVY